jgi:uncharacterized protein with GYD domain
MSYFMLEVCYTTEAWANMLKNPQNRGEAVRAAVEGLGGKVENYWLAFGERDAIAICQMPNNINAAAFSLAALSGGACKSIKTTPLLTGEEGIEAMKKAAISSYRPPSSKAKKAGA